MSNIITLTQHQKDEMFQWLKAILLVAALTLFMGAAHAADSTGVADLDKQATAFQSGVKMVAKWGGILLVVLTGILIGTGKAQGQTATYLAYAGIAIGLVIAAWGWFSNNFTEGFVF